ncbi:uncharacterized protein EI90DRAFT_2910625 [Cantharellus anzutake]|uniref:uncharacterized protein n=1 Tax=Cantharellus anzutake TaxID=1750568 RepID=UPI00190803E5|nr:uncharacterized protein EI90DRAFT_2910625 [Cantharellus anzutake]KAF8337601.1 hypothetical protein EI90DRAFT_2910625 [Cantharellus anzutake]
MPRNTSQVLEESFYVRDEYNILNEFVEKQRELAIAGPLFLRANVTCWTTWNRSVGCAGLSLHNTTNHTPKGKTVYLTYCLLNRLAQGKPTVLSKSRLMRFAFLRSGVYMVPGDSFDFWNHPEVHAARADLRGLVLFDLTPGEKVDNPHRRPSCKSCIIG